MRNLIKNHGLAKSISDPSRCLFRHWIDYLAGKFGKIAVAVAPHYRIPDLLGRGVSMIILT